MAEDKEKRSRLSQDAKRFNELVDVFIERVIAGDYPVPSDFNLIRFLNIDPKTYQYYQDNAENHGYKEGFEKLRMFREDFWMKRSIEAKTATAAMFHLRQAKNGGYVDKQEKSNDPIKVEVVIKGCDNAFK